MSAACSLALRLVSLSMKEIGWGCPVCFKQTQVVSSLHSCFSGIETTCFCTAVSRTASLFSLWSLFCFPKAVRDYSKLLSGSFFRMNFLRLWWLVELSFWSVLAMLIIWIVISSIRIKSGALWLLVLSKWMVNYNIGILFFYFPCPALGSWFCWCSVLLFWWKRRSVSAWVFLKWEN